MWFNFDRRSEEKLKSLTRGQLVEEESEEESLYCFVCGHAITKIDERISISGRNEHIFSNPAGCVFRIGCFRNAPGCSHAGSYTDAHTWFPGYSWCYALCSECKVHLGWCYKSNDQFFGLILDRLISHIDKKFFSGNN